MCTNPLFSVLIANYNDGKYLLEAVESIMIQSYKNWEIIIVDDCSTDDSMDIMNTLNDSRIHVFRNDKNRGCGYTKRKLVELANGDVCGFVDADDCITNDALSVMVEAHQAHPECSIVYSRYYAVDEKLQVQYESESQRTLSDGESVLDYPGAISHFVSFKKSKYVLTEGLNPSLRCAEDLDLYYKLEEVGTSLFIPRPLYYYRMFTGNNVSLGEDKAYKAMAYEIIASADACRRRGLPIEDHITMRMMNVVEEARAEGIDIGQNRVKSSKSFRIGKKILSPIKKAQKIFYKIAGS